MTRRTSRPEYDEDVDGFVAAVDRAIATLPADHRAVLLARAGEGLGYAEIGRRLGIEPEIARDLYAAAIVALRRALDASL